MSSPKITIKRMAGHFGETSRYVCFGCRVCFHGTMLCPHCKTSMHYVGTHFRAPKRSDKRSWALLEAIGFSRSFREGKGTLPRCTSEVGLYLKAVVQKTRMSLREELRMRKKGAPVFDARGRYTQSTGRFLMSSMN